MNVAGIIAIGVLAIGTWLITTTIECGLFASPYMSFAARRYSRPLPRAIVASFLGTKMKQKKDNLLIKF